MAEPGQIGRGSPAIRIVRSPLTSEMLRPLDARVEVVQFASRLTDDDFRTLGEWLKEYPEVMLRAYGSYDGSIRDLDFLRFFPNLRLFQADALYHSLESIEGLSYLPADAAYVGIGITKKRLSLRPLERFTKLRRLYLEGQTKDIEVISDLTSLRELVLRSVTLSDLSLLLPLTNLRALDLKLGGTRNIELLPEIGQIEYLEIWMVRGLADIAPAAHMHHLNYLFLQALKNVTHLPDLSDMPRLETVWLETMKGLSDLSPLLTAPSLKRVAIVDMPQLQPEDVGVLAQVPSLENLIAGLGSKKKNDAVQQLVPLPRGAGWRKPQITID